jgi:hypothetical protein
MNVRSKKRQIATIVKSGRAKGRSTAASLSRTNSAMSHSGARTYTRASAVIRP